MTVPVPSLFSPSESSSNDTLASLDGFTVPSPESVTTVSSFMNSIRPSSEGYPATEVIKYLIEAVGHDVMSFRRNTQVSYLLVDRARDICDAINGCIQRTESGEDWMSFDKFTNAIDPVEEALFQLIAFTEDERTLYLAPGTSVGDCVSSVERWVTNREKIWSALHALETQEDLVELFPDLDIPSRQTDRLDARQRDDKTFFEEIVGDIKGALKSFKRLPAAIRNVDAILHELLTKLTEGPTSPWLTVYTVKTGLLLQGTVNLSLRPSPIDNETRNHLRSRAVWEAAEELTQLLNSTTGDDKATIDGVRLKYEAFVRLLLNTSELPIPQSYVELMKQAGQVRRPFYAQALALILLCRILVVEFEQKHRRTAENALALEDACDETFNALNKVIAAVTELKIFDTTNLEDHAASQALAVAIGQIRACYAAFGLDDSWSEKEQLLADAVKKDKARMEELNKRLATRPPLTIQERAAQVKVFVSVYYQSGEAESPVPVGEVPLEVEGSARLRALRWTVAGSLEEQQLARPARQNGKFLLAPDDKPCELHRSVSELLTDSSNECALKLIVQL